MLAFYTINNEFNFVFLFSLHTEPLIDLKSSFFSVARDSDGKPLIGYCLTDHVIRDVRVKDKIQCAALCIQDSACKSVNFRDGVCELNSHGRNDVGESYFGQSAGCHYFEPV